MQFTPLVLLLTLFLPIYYALPRKRQWIALLAVSWGFVLYSGPENYLFLLAVSLSCHLAARCMGKRKKLPLILCLGFNFSLLALCKAALAEPLRSTLAGGPLDFPALPLGISFYLFGTAGYLLDVYRGKQAPEPNFFRFSLFAAYLPQLVQGPISRYAQLGPQLTAGCRFDAGEVSLGFQRLLWGLFKKLVIADRIAPAVKALTDPQYGGTGFVLLGIFYAVQIYGDFTGGIDMALGFSRMLGIRLPENFQHPFFSKNTAEYWRRWHMTLGAWMKDYVFYPLSVSKPMLKLSRFSRRHLGRFGRRLPVYLASLATWAVTGIWHGITPNFLLWGMMNCLVILISQELTPLYRRFHRRFHLKERPWYGAFEMLRMFILMNFIRVCDLFPQVSGWFRGWGMMVTRPNLSLLWDGSLLNLGLSGLDWGILAIACGLVFTVSLRQVRGCREIALHPLVRYGLIFALFLSILLLGRYGVGYDAAGFIYNQF